MSKAVGILHGEFGRAMLMTLDQPLTVHAHRTCQVLFKIDGPAIEMAVRDQRYRLGDDEVILALGVGPGPDQVTGEPEGRQGGGEDRGHREGGGRGACG